MEITSMIICTREIINDINKCVNLYHFCNDKETIYYHILNAVDKLQNDDVARSFLDQGFDETSSIDVLKEELLLLYREYTNQFINLLRYYSNEIVDVIN